MGTENFKEIDYQWLDEIQKKKRKTHDNISPEKKKSSQKNAHDKIENSVP